MGTAEFRASTPRLLFTLLERLREVREAERLMAEHRAGVIAATIANVHRDDTKRPEPYGPGFFFPALRQPQREMSDDELLEQVMRLDRRIAGAAAQA